MKWSFEENNYPLRFTWKIAHGSSTSKKISFVKVSEGQYSGIGEAAFLTKDEKNINPKGEFERFEQSLSGEIFNTDSLDAHLLKLKLSAPMRFAISSAYTHFWSQVEKRPVSSILGTHITQSVKTSFSIPIIDPSDFEKYYKEHDLERFHALKIKIQNEQCIELYSEVARLYDGQIRLDGNEGWKDPDKLINFVSQLDLDHIEFLEQPMCSEEHDGLKYLKSNSPVKLMADESITSGDVTQFHADRFHAVNIKLMKSGSYLVALEQIAQAKALGMEVMLGCMVESSLGIWSAMQIAHGLDYFDLDGFLLFKDDPNDFVTEENGMITLY